MKNKHTCDHTRCREDAAHNEERLRTFEAALERLLKPHRPYPQEEGLRPGNSHSAIKFYCHECRQTWPCSTFNDLRALYGEVNDWAPATQPYNQLTLYRADADPTSERRA